MNDVLGDDDLNEGVLNEGVLDMASIRQNLRDELATLQERIAARLGQKDEGPNPDRNDLAQAYTSRERKTALLAIERERLDQIQNALERIEDGTYGRCTVCGEAIGAERLQVLPHATLCVSCQALRE